MPANVGVVPTSRPPLTRYEIQKAFSPNQIWKNHSSYQTRKNHPPYQTRKNHSPYFGNRSYNSDMCQQVDNVWKCGHRSFKTVNFCHIETCKGTSADHKDNNLDGDCHTCETRKAEENNGTKRDDPWGKDDPYKSQKKTTPEGTQPYRSFLRHKCTCRWLKTAKATVNISSWRPH
ncbi:hypothetical protein GGTG_07739 [Gaeumannomyces tritici R3-111a-1]|uniref:Uncharacterized protein n=1 Tax=Gaeumannomyces tritici (strain R3-111a-1) TaxID=644352 RepID=J3P2J3_GAET3|nr:hypothetical protein GGTG_07739 [Gaeumannomyces tritici R3-111a-1]EJT73885.1 hypothetical protein GGTG_07739 [Gaeumannomyces tritici R3-111a-1]